MLNKFIPLSLLLVLPFWLMAQPKTQNFIYLDRISPSDLQGKKVIELIKTQIITKVKTKSGQEMEIDNNVGYLVTYKTISGKDLGINGLLIDDEQQQTGELVFYEIGTRDGLKFEKIYNNMIYLKRKSTDGKGQSFDLYLTCKLMQ